MKAESQDIVRERTKLERRREWKRRGETNKKKLINTITLGEKT